VGTSLLEALHHLRIPTTAELFDCADINVSVVKELLKLRHITLHETTILMHRVAAHGDLSRLAIPLEKIEQD
jgi:hypothetical protein